MSDSAGISEFDTARGARHPRAHVELLRNYFIDLISVHMRLRIFKPLITNFYVTQKCNLRCTYCYPPGDEPDSDLASNIALLTKIRPRNPVINFTGGEPLLYPDIVELIRKARELRFYPILLSTNALLTDKLEQLLPLIDHLIVSLDSIEEESNDALAGVSGATREILGNIEKSAIWSRQYGHRMTLHSVITPHNLDDIAGVVKLSELLHITFSVSPQHGRYHPNPELPGNPRYMALVDHLIDLKGRGMPIVCSFDYLKAIRGFPRRRCYPFVSPRVFPDGSVYFPCERIRDTRLFLHDYDSLISLMRKHAEFSFRPECSSRCYLACYVEVERYLRNPLSILNEIPMLRIVSGARIKRRRGGRN